MNCALITSYLPLIAVALIVATAAADAAPRPLDPARVKAIAAMLPEHPAGLGRPIADRSAWEALAAQDAYKGAVARAAETLAKPLPEQTDELFLDFSRTGNRDNWQRVAFERRGRLNWYVLAECLENKGRFLPAIEELITAFAAEKTWMMPAHDGTLTNFEGKIVDIDLGSSALGWSLATADYLLGDRLTPAVRADLRSNLRRRITDPYRAMFTGKRLPNWWMLTTNNWNAVCLAGVTGTALAEIESRRERAEFVAAAETYSRNFLAGFTADGYCSEGLGYWDYGFGHYVLLAETIRQATGGKVDLMRLPEVKAPASFGERIQIIGGVSPAFADCDVRARPSALIMYFVNRIFGMGLHEYDGIRPQDSFGDLFEMALYGFANGASESKPATAASAGLPLRSWFDKAGILIARPAALPPSPARRGAGGEASCHFGVALKGGNNAEHHNHNDVGSYVVVCGDRPVLLDPGAEVYTARTFSAKRYDSKLLNSFGHAVPIIAGQLQREGLEAHAEILRADFTDKVDTLRMQIKSAYAVPELKSLVRTFVYSRQGEGSLSVADHVQFATPQTYATALITLGGWHKLDDGGLLIYDMDQAVRADIDTGGKPYELKAEEIHENAPVTPTRIGIALAEPVTDATVTIRITPMAMPAAQEGGNLLRNGDFELGSWGWDVPRDGISAVSEEQAAGGKASLKITDASKTLGSNVSSARIAAKGAGVYELRGKAYHVRGQGIGMYAKLLDAQGNPLNHEDERGNIAPVGSLAGAEGKWEAFSFRFTTPAKTAAMQLWIHSYDGAEVEAFLDDLEIVKAEPLPLPGAKSSYHGFDRYDFTVDGRSALVVVPKQAAPGRPWIWRAEFFDHRPEADLALLEKGWHLAFIEVGNTFGCPSAMAHWDVFYRDLTAKYGLSQKPALEGLSRGGLYVYNWAAANPDKVGCLYGDAPVCDFKSWPGGKGKGPGSPDDWKKLIGDYGFASEAEALAFPRNPVDNLAPLARAGIPILHVYGDADEVVPWDENTGVIAERYKKLGGHIELICKPGGHHHPHALDDPTPIVQFCLKYAAGE